MARFTGAEVAEKHARRLKASTDDIRRGVQRVREAPGAKAAAQQEKMRARLLASIDSGKWAQRTAAVDVETWRDKMINVGVGRIAAGVDANMDKTAEFFDQLLEHEDRLSSKIERMPSISLEDNIQRATEWMRGMSEFKRR